MPTPYKSVERKNMKGIKVCFGIKLNSVKEIQNRNQQDPIKQKGISIHIKKGVWSLTAGKRNSVICPQSQRNNTNCTVRKLPKSGVRFPFATKKRIMARLMQQITDNTKKIKKFTCIQNHLQCRNWFNCSIFNEMMKDRNFLFNALIKCDKMELYHKDCCKIVIWGGYKWNSQAWRVFA